MSDTYLIPQFIIDYLQKSRSTKSPQKLAKALLKKNKTLEIENWFKENEVTTSYIWKFFVFYGLNKFSFRECPECGKRVKLNTILHNPDAKYCSKKCLNSSEEFKEKRKQTCLEKYGVEYSLQVKEIQEKRKQTCRSNHWETFCSLLKEKEIVPLFLKEEYINNTGRKFKCLSCNEKFESEGTYTYKKEHKNKDGTYTTLQVINIYCPHCYKAPYSLKEKDVAEFVKSIYDGEILENNRTALFEEGKKGHQRELDIFLPALNLGIEFDGTYWHSKEEAKQKDEIKNKLAKEKGIKLIRIKESEWDNNRKAVEKQILEVIESLK